MDEREIVKVIGGAYKGRNISYPRGAVNLRPTSALVRKAVFDMVGSMPDGLGAIEGSEVVDLYAGTGMLGIEAISRGAGRVTFVESNRRAVASIKRNLDDLGIPAGKYGIVHSEVGRFLRGSADSEVGSGSIFDIAFIDAPYDLDYSMPDAYSGGTGEKHATVIGGNVLVRLQASLAVIETRPGDYIIPSGWEVIKQRRYGGTMVTVLRGWH